MSDIIRSFNLRIHPHLLSRRATGRHGKLIRSGSVLIELHGLRHLVHNCCRFLNIIRSTGGEQGSDHCYPSPTFHCRFDAGNLT